MIAFSKKFIFFWIHIFKGKIEIAFSQFRFTTGVYSFISHIYFGENEKKSDKLAVFYLDQGLHARYVFNVLNTFKLSEYDIILKPSWKFYRSSIGGYKFYIYKFLKVGYKNRHNYKYHLEIIDSNVANILSHRNVDKTLYTNYKVDFESKKFRLPFSFHPWIFILNNFHTYQQVQSYLTHVRSLPRTVRVLFSGQIFDEMYNKLNITFKDQISRNSLFKYIFNEFKESIIVSAENIESNKKILISDHTNTPKLWLEYLSQSDFFIAPPGFEMPFCHNIIEAMAVGVIPILQYNNLFSPSLEHKQNCLSFSSLEELKNCLNLALNIDQPEIEIMRRNVIEYYNCFLSPVSFTNEVETSDLKKINFSVIAGASSYIP